MSQWDYEPTSLSNQMYSPRIVNLEPMLQKIRDSREFFMELAEEQPWPEY